MDKKTANAGDQGSVNQMTENKANLGGSFNSGVTSTDDTIKRQIEKQGSMLNFQPQSHNEEMGLGASKKLSPRGHALVDYALLGSLLIVPAAMGLSRTVRIVYLVEALTLGAYVAMTDQPLSIKPLIPFKTHGKVDRFNVAGFALQTFSKPFRKSQKASVFNLIFTAIAAVSVLCTNWNSKR